MLSTNNLVEFFVKKAAHPNHQEMEECKVAEKVSDEDLKNLRDHSQPKTTPMKCFIACMGEKSGKVDKFKIKFFRIKLRTLFVNPNRS